MNRVTVISYQDELLFKAKSIEEQKFVKALFPAIWAANSKIMGYLMTTPIMEIYPPKLREISGNTFKYRLERGIASNFKGSVEDFQYKFWHSESVEDFIESYTKKEGVDMVDFINIRGGSVPQLKLEAAKTYVPSVKEEDIRIADVWKNAEEKAKSLTLEAETLLKNTKTNIFDIIHDFEEKHGIKIVSFECGGTTFDRKLGNEAK